MLRHTHTRGRVRGPLFLAATAFALIASPLIHNAALAQATTSGEGLITEVPEEKTSPVVSAPALTPKEAAAQRHAARVAEARERAEVRSQLREEKRIERLLRYSADDYRSKAATRRGMGIAMMVVAPTVLVGGSIGTVRGARRYRDRYPDAWFRGGRAVLGGFGTAFGTIAPLAVGIVMLRSAGKLERRANEREGLERLPQASRSVAPSSIDLPRLMVGISPSQVALFGSF